MHQESVLEFVECVEVTCRPSQVVYYYCTVPSSLNLVSLQNKCNRHTHCNANISEITGSTTRALKQLARMTGVLETASVGPLPGPRGVVVNFYLPECSSCPSLSPLSLPCPTCLPFSVPTPPSPSFAPLPSLHLPSFSSPPLPLSYPFPSPSSPLPPLEVGPFYSARGFRGML